MADSRRFEAWQHTAKLLQKLHNVHCTKAAHLIREPGSENPMLTGQGRGGTQPMTADFNATMYEVLKRREREKHG